MEMGVGEELGSSCHNQKSRVFPVIVGALGPLTTLKKSKLSNFILTQNTNKKYSNNAISHVHHNGKRFSIKYSPTHTAYLAQSNALDLVINTSL